MLAGIEWVDTVSGLSGLLVWSSLEMPKTCFASTSQDQDTSSVDAKFPASTRVLTSEAVKHVTLSLVVHFWKGLISGSVSKMGFKGRSSFGALGLWGCEAVFFLHSSSIYLLVKISHSLKCTFAFHKLDKRRFIDVE